jgi:hypothetical protein
MYPNPVNSLLTIQSDQPVARISVTDLQGKQLVEKSGNCENYQVETGSFSPGAYFCQLYFSDGTSKQLKFIRE